MAKITDKYLVVKDTRERQGYEFKPYDICEGMIQEKLDTGDYTLSGLEDLICVERKSSVEELANNLGKDKRRFMDEIKRMKNFKHKYLLLEFDAGDVIKFPLDSRVPKDRISDKNGETVQQKKQRNKVIVSGKYIMKCLMEFQLYEDINILFCGDRYNGFLTLNSLFKRLHEMYTIGRKK